MICVFIKTNPTFEKISAVSVNENDKVKKIALQRNAIIERDFKSEHLFRTCSVATNLVTSLEFHSNLSYYIVPLLANYGTVPYSLVFTPIAVQLQAVLQENTEPFRNGRVERRNRTV